MLEKVFAEGSACWGTNGFAQQTAKIISAVCSKLLLFLLTVIKSGSCLRERERVCASLGGSSELSQYFHQ